MWNYVWTINFSRSLDVYNFILTLTCLELTVLRYGAAKSIIRHAFKNLHGEYCKIINAIKIYKSFFEHFANRLVISKIILFIPFPPLTPKQFLCRSYFAAMRCRQTVVGPINWDLHSITNVLLAFFSCSISARHFCILHPPNLASFRLCASSA